MKLKTKHQLSTQFNMSSMTDLVFLLLLFFMLSSSFVASTSLPIDLPASQTSQATTAQVYITITSRLHYYIGNQQIGLAELKTMLQDRLPAQNGMVLLQVDKSVPIEYVIEVIDIANALHAEVSIATRPAP